MFSVIVFVNVLNIYNWVHDIDSFVKKVFDNLVIPKLLGMMQQKGIFYIV